jgi:hypothetical protein
MIPRDFITAWRSEAPWVQDRQVEQDLVISRALVEQNLAAKARDPLFAADMSPLLAAGLAWEPSQAFERVQSELVAMLPGAAWRG